MVRTKGLVGLVLLLAAHAAAAQVDEDQTGAWYMYFWNTTLENSRFGFQGDVQHRNWDIGGDLEQLLIRGGGTWQPEGSRNRYTLGYAHITSGVFGASGAKSREDRLYQEALIPQTLGRKVYLTHRFRLEQRWVDNQDFRNRARYFFGLNYPFNQDTLGRGAIYLAFYNELFVNLERDIGEGRRVDYFDRNRLYLAAGWSATDRMRLQFGYMHQQTDSIGKGQLQIGLFHTF
jgi:hypothetical protein